MTSSYPPKTTRILKTASTRRLKKSNSSLCQRRLWKQWIMIGLWRLLRRVTSSMVEAVIRRSKEAVPKCLRCYHKARAPIELKNRAQDPGLDSRDQGPSLPIFMTNRASSPKWEVVAVLRLFRIWILPTIQFMTSTFTRANFWTLVGRNLGSTWSMQERAKASKITNLKRGTTKKRMLRSRISDRSTETDKGLPSSVKSAPTSTKPWGICRRYNRCQRLRRLIKIRICLKLRTKTCRGISWMTLWASSQIWSQSMKRWRA